MELDNLTVDLIKELEYIIGNKVYNKNTKNPDGEDGRKIRYPCLMRDSKDWKFYRYKGKLYDADSDSITSAYYNFGANDLDIGDALVKMLEFIEKRYGIDFNQLEKERITNRDYDPSKEPEEGPVDCDAYDDE